MKAILLKEHGGVEGFSVEEIPEPEVRPGHLLVKVAASSVNPVDYKIRQGLLPVGPVLPGILHGDMAGTITQVGEGVEGFEVGDEVYGCVVDSKECRGLVGICPCRSRLVAKKPSNLSMVEAAALPLVGITAWNALIDRARVCEPKDSRSCRNWRSRACGFATGQSIWSSGSCNRIR